MMCKMTIMMRSSAIPTLKSATWCLNLTSRAERMFSSLRRQILPRSLLVKRQQAVSSETTPLLLNLTVLPSTTPTTPTNSSRSPTSNLQTETATLTPTLGTNTATKSPRVRTECQASTSCPTLAQSLRLIWASKKCM